MLVRTVSVVMMLGLLAGCGLAASGGAAAVNGAAAADEAKAAQKQLEKVQADVDAAQKKAAEGRAAAEAEAR